MSVVDFTTYRTPAEIEEETVVNGAIWKGVRNALIPSLLFWAAFFWLMSLLP
jgi:hypothetical protein